MNNLKKFNDDLHEKNIYKNIIEIIQNDKGYLEGVFIGKDSAKKQVEILIKQSFKGLFTRCSKEGKEKIREIISNNLNFPDYFGIGVNNKDEELYDNFQVHELLKNLSESKKNELIKAAFESQRGNYLLLITFFAQKKIEEKGFLEQLEKNYGVYLDVDNFIKEMNQKISEIKTYKALFEYIGADFIKEEKYKDKNDLELIIDAYQMALDKKYINQKQQGMRSLSQSLSQSYNINNNIIQPVIPIPYIQPNNAFPLFASNMNNNFQNRQNLYNSGNSFWSLNRDRNRCRNRDRSRERRNRDRRDRDRRRRDRSRSRSRSRSYSRSSSY
jgi:hypothetical protein